MSVNLNNLQRAETAWGADMPAWVRTLANACDRTNQREVGLKLTSRAKPEGYSSGTISKLLNKKYPGDLIEAEKQVRAVFGAETVPCPAMSCDMQLRTCLKNRRRSTPPRNFMHHAFDRHCPNCVFNTDREEDL